jgi:hypothetical protein
MFTVLLGLESSYVEEVAPRDVAKHFLDRARRFCCTTMIGYRNFGGQLSFGYC